jgi:hypothetical protein
VAVSYFILTTVLHLGQLEEIYLNGNHLRNEGVIQILRGTAVNKNLKMLSVADN